MTNDETRRRRGRPRVEPADQSVSVHLRLSAKTYAAMSERARETRSTVPEVIRRTLDPRAARRD